ncbi:hypothetical protein EFA46_009655 [Halarchaeum sp. CBA1220]|uniref:DUF7266 family protein n=1 Tax=Halarchaeum sp. CBA1220 TaxID=1853682 RepID=UPI000F3AA625|nr:hypothetical protein [Halarchaeum sp. CBA1220]QLC34458.1 hypothetical protein EFA46_009655 [Halarchaeum sp. CBA1220]
MADVGRDDGRGVATVVGYVLNIGIALLVVTGLLIAASGFVGDQRERAVDTELQVIGDRFANDLATADRLLTQTDAEFVAVDAPLPSRVVGRSYTVHVGDPGPAGGAVRVVLTAPRSDVTVSRTIHLEHGLARNTTHAGGSLRVVADGDELEVRDG